MPALKIEQVQIALPAATLRALAECLEAGGINAGTLFVGPVSRHPEFVRLAWYHAGEAPASAIVARVSLGAASGGAAAAAAILQDWRCRRPL